MSLEESRVWQKKDEEENYFSQSIYSFAAYLFCFTKASQNWGEELYN